MEQLPMTDKNQSSTESNQPTASNSGGIYQIKIKGLLDDHWQQWFEGMTLTRVDSGGTSKGMTLISGPIQDQPALHGLLAKIRDLNLTLISVYRINSTSNKKEKTQVDMSPKERVGKDDPDQMEVSCSKTEPLQDKVMLVGVCGLYCGACYHYLASFPENAHLLTDENLQGRKREGFVCLGCRSDQLYIHPGCAECKIRPCAQSRGILHCGLCEQYPCDQLLSLQNDGRSHHREILDELRRLLDDGPDKWLKDQQLRWTCPCGSPFSWYEEFCMHCGSQLRSFSKSEDQ
jgi:uncharacterized protein DUF3795